MSLIMPNSSSHTIPPFHSLPFSAYYRTECQDKYCTSRLAYHVANDNECASSLLLDPYQENQHIGYQSHALIHGHQYSRKVRCFGPWVNAASFAQAALSEISSELASSSATKNPPKNEAKSNNRFKKE